MYIHLYDYNIYYIELNRPPPRDSRNASNRMAPKSRADPSRELLGFVLDHELLTGGILSLFASLSVHVHLKWVSLPPENPLQ
jgi:hypothetical protein